MESNKTKNINLKSIDLFANPSLRSVCKYWKFLIFLSQYGQLRGHSVAHCPVIHEALLLLNFLL